MATRSLSQLQQSLAFNQMKVEDQLQFVFYVMCAKKATMNAAVFRQGCIEQMLIDPLAAEDVYILTAKGQAWYDRGAQLYRRHFTKHG